MILPDNCFNNQTEDISVVENSAVKDGTTILILLNISNFYIIQRRLELRRRCFNFKIYLFGR